MRRMQVDVRGGDRTDLAKGPIPCAGKQTPEPRMPGFSRTTECLSQSL